MSPEPLNINAARPEFFLQFTALSLSLFPFLHSASSILISVWKMSSFKSKYQGNYPLFPILWTSAVLFRSQCTLGFFFRISAWSVVFYVFLFGWFVSLDLVSRIWSVRSILCSSVASNRSDEALFWWLLCFPVFFCWDLELFYLILSGFSLFHYL